MAKNVKKKTAAKPAAKSAKKTPVKAPAKAVAKPAAKKVVAKAAPKKSPVKAVAKPAKKTEVSKKKLVAKQVETPKAKKPEKKSPQPVADKVAIKKESKASKKTKVKKEKEENDLDDDFIADDDMMGDEIGEYEEELKAVEEADEEVETEEVWTGEEKPKTDEEIILTDAEGRRYCRARDCDQISAVDAYCRYHYLLFWKRIQIRKKILIDGKLERYIEELTSRYPDKFLEMIRRDLRTEKDFLAAIHELELDESNTEGDFEEDTSAFIEEVRGMGDSGGSVEEDDF